MLINAGEKFPLGIFRIKDSEGVKEISTEQYFKSQKVVLFALPGAFTPTCSAKHLPGFINHHGKIISKGVSKVACMAVNDPHVMNAWGEVSGADGKIDMLSDSDCSISVSLGGDRNFGEVLGHRSKRFAMIVDDSIIIKSFIEEVGSFEVSSAEIIINTL